MFKNDNENKYNDLIYKRGFLITKKEVTPPKQTWNKKKIDKYFLYYDPLNDVEFLKENEKWVVILGTTIDVLNNTSNKEEICRNLIKQLKISEDVFFDYLDEISGRYLIMYNDGEKTKVLSDATGMRTVIYSSEQTVIASHVQLVQAITNSTFSPLIENHWNKKYGGTRLPGHYTPYDDIFFLTPNTLLEVESNSVKRFFPRETLETESVDKVVDEISRLVKEQLKLIVDTNQNILFSLTAGLDSRTTLSLAKEVTGRTQFFTYYKVSKQIPKGVKSLEIDREVVGDMVDNLNLNHDFIPLNIDETNKEFNEFVGIMKKNTFISHSYRLAKFYYDELPREVIHVRSNLLEIGRSFYRNLYKLPEYVDPSTLAQCYSPKAVEDKEVQLLLSRYYEVVEMGSIFNYDPYDIFYWEYRMGTWHSQILLESDVAHDTFIPFNCRRILKLLLSVPDKDKKNFTLFKQIITKNWPILNYWGINTLEKPMDKLDDQINEYGFSLKGLKFKSNTIFESKNIGKKSKFHLNKSAPMKGDYVEATIPFNTINSSFYHIILQLRSPYENRKNVGRLKYQVLLDDKLLVEEDIALWKESNNINVHFKAQEKKSNLTIKIIAVKNCEAWNWGKASNLIIERFIVRKSDRTNEVIEVTSPHSSIVSNSELYTY